jgi:large subunit ribosomal protein L17
MLRNMVSTLIEHERIITTEAKAKELRHLADHVISLAKCGQRDKDATQELAHRHRVAEVVRGDWNILKLFDVLGPHYKHRDGGYPRVMKLARKRHGNNAPMAVIE